MKAKGEVGPSFSAKIPFRILMSRYPELFLLGHQPKNTSGLIKILQKIIRISTIALCMCIYIYVTHIYVHMIDFHSNVTNATWKLLSQDFSWRLLVKTVAGCLCLTCVQGGPPTRYNLGYSSYNYGEITPVT